MLRTILLGTATAACTPLAATALSVSLTDDPSVLAAATLAPTSGISIVAGSESLIGSETQQGTYSDFDLPSSSGSEPDLSLTDGVVLTSGGGGFSTTENTSNSFSEATGTGSHAPLVDLASEKGLSTVHNDSNVLSFDFILDDAEANAVSTQFLFATDEFPTQSVTDIMAIFVNGVNYAFFSNGDLVSNQNGDPNNFFNNNAVGSGTYGIEWNGLTDVFNVTGLANGEGAVNNISFAIADTSDTIYDSAMFFSNLTSTVTQGGGGIDVPVIPLPAGLPLLLAGLGGFAVVRSRKRS